MVITDQLPESMRNYVSDILLSNHRHQHQKVGAIARTRRQSVVNLFKGRTWSGASEAVENDDVELRPAISVPNEDGTEAKEREDVDESYEHDASQRVRCFSSSCV